MQRFVSRALAERTAVASNSETLANFATGTSPAKAITVVDSENGNIEIEEDVDLDKLLDVNSTICIEKEIAADTMGTLFSATRRHFLPYVEQCTIELVGLLPHYYDGIRKSSVESLLEIVRTLYDLSDPQDWTPGANAVSRLRQWARERCSCMCRPFPSIRR